MSGSTLFSIGEALIDMIPSRVGCSFDEVPSFSPRTGGAPANVCAAFARLGGKSAFLSQLGDDPFGHKIARELEACGIDLSHLAFTDKASTALAFVSLEEDGSRTFSFYRKPSADLLYSPEQIDPAWFADAFALHYCSVSLVDSPMRYAHLAAIAAAREAGSIVSFDPNLRFPLWPDRDMLRGTVLQFLPLSNILKISDEELEFLTALRTLKPPCRSCSWAMCSWCCTPAAAAVPTPTPAPPTALPPAGKSGLWTPPAQATASSARFCGSWNVTA